MQNTESNLQVSIIPQACPEIFFHLGFLITANKIYSLRAKTMQLIVWGYMYMQVLVT